MTNEVPTSLLDQARLPARASGQWLAYRQVGPMLPALWNPYRLQPFGRWHTGRERAQYFALDTDGAWAEIISRHGSDATLVAEQRRLLWNCWIQDTDLADLRSAAEINACGLDLAAMTDLYDYSYCNQLGGELRAVGYRGVLSPNACLEGAVNLTLFGDRFPSPLAPGAVSRGALANPRPQVFVLVSEASEDALAPSRLLPFVRPR